VFRTAKQLSAPRPGGAAAGRPAGQLPALGLARSKPAARPQLPFRKPAMTAGPVAANEAAAAPLGQPAGCASAAGAEGAAAAAAGAEAASEELGGGSCALSPPLAAAGSGAPGASQPGLKRPPLKPLLPNRFKRPAMAAPASKLAAEPEGTHFQQQDHQHRAQMVAAAEGTATEAAAPVGRPSAGAGAGSSSSDGSRPAEGGGAQSVPAEPRAPVPRLVAGLKRGRGGFKPPLLSRQQQK
jgi:hypothetical protein